MPRPENVLGRIDIGVVAIIAGDAPEGAWSGRFSADTWPQSEQVRLVFRGSTRTRRPPRPESLYSRKERNVPHPREKMERFSPDFCRTFRPGVSRVPRALQVMFRIFRSST